MNAFTKMSDKGQVVVPAATRVRLHWRPGTELEVIEHGDSVTLRPRQTTKTLTPEQAVERFKRLYTHQGLPVSIAEMNEAVAKEADRRAARR